MASSTTTCGTVRPGLEAWARDGLPEAGRREVMAHLAVCEGCRAAATRLDPSALFIRLRGSTLPAEFWRGFDSTLRARIEAGRARSLPARLAGRVAAWAAEGREALAWSRAPALWAAPAAMILVLGVVVGVMRHDLFAPAPRSPRVDVLRSPYDSPRGPARPGAPAPAGAAGSPAGRPAVTVLPALLPVGGDPPALEEVASPSARVYRFDAAEAGADPIYLVVDESIEF